MSSDSKEGVYAVCGTMLGLSGLSVGLRFYTRRKQRASILVDDILSVASLATFIGAAAVAIHMVRRRIIGHPGSTEIRGEYSAKMQIIWSIFVLLSLALSKLSALFFYRRIFYIGGQQNWFNIVILGTAVVVVLWLIVFEFLTGFQCGTHFSALWDGTYLTYCTISFPFLYGLALSDFLLDIWILALPIPSVLRLKATWPKKLGVLGIFALSLIGVFASGNRVAQLVQLVNGGPEYLINYDEQRAITLVVYFVNLEAGVSLVAVNLPTLWFLVTLATPFMHSLSTRLLPSTMRSTENKTGSAHSLTKSPATRPGGTPPRQDTLSWSDCEVENGDVYSWNVSSHVGAK